MELIESRVWSERWRLAVLTRDDLIRIGLISGMVGLAFVLFHLQGNTTDIRMYGRSAILWMKHRWSDSGGDFSHGALIPFVSAAVIWYRRRELLEASKHTSRAGLAIVIASLLLHWLGAKAQQPRLSLIALIGLSWGVPFYLCGWELAKYLVFPCAYLAYCIPLNFLEDLTFPLRILATVISTSLLNGLGVPATRSGSGIHIELAGGTTFDVAAECSGLRSLIAMTALAAVWAFLTQKTLLKKWLLFACSIPIAIVNNIVRITMIIIVAQVFGSELAWKLWHDYSGFIIFFVGVMLLVAASSLLSMNFSEVWRKWKHALTSPTS